MPVRPRVSAIVVAMFFIAVLLAGCPSQTTQPPPAAETRDDSAADAARSWIDFVAEAMGNCDANCCVDYQAFHEEGDQYIGVMVVGYRDSEYIADMYRYDSEKDEWVTSPKRETELGEQIDYQAAAEQWGVPENQLESWISDAESAVQRKYSRQ